MPEDDSLLPDDSQRSADRKRANKRVVTLFLVIVSVVAIAALGLAVAAFFFLATSSLSAVGSNK